MPRVCRQVHLGSVQQGRERGRRARGGRWRRGRGGRAGAAFCRLFIERGKRVNWMIPMKVNCKVGGKMGREGGEEWQKTQLG